MPEFSVVIPVYRSQKFIQQLTNELLALFQKLNKSFEIIFVDDASPDNSFFEIAEVRKEFPSIIHVLRLKKNYGQYTATVCGLIKATGDFIITMDADMNADQIEKVMVDLHPDDELVYGEIKGGSRNIFRKAGSFLFNTIIKISTSHSFDSSDNVGSSLRVMKKTLAEKIFNKLQYPLMLDIILIGSAKKIKFTPVTAADQDLSSYSGLALANQGIQTLLAILSSKLFSGRKISIYEICEEKYT